MSIQHLDNFGAVISSSGILDLIVLYEVYIHYNHLSKWPIGGGKNKQLVV